MKNFFIFIFSYKARLYLAYVFIALNILQVLFGCVMTIASIYICITVTKYLYAEKAEIQFVFTVFAIFGTHIIFQYLVGIKIVELCFVKAHKRSTKRNVYFWLILCCNTIINLLILAGLIVRISKHIVRSIRHSMEKGMRHYLRDVVWKHTMDRWQYSLRCCGVNDFQDWYRISWLDRHHIKADSPRVQSLLLSKDHLHLPITPWSCCDMNFPMQCFHDPLQQIDSVFVWKEHPDVPEMSLYRTGCLEVIRYPIEMCLVLFLTLCVLLIITHVVIMVVSRFLYTSCRNAVVLHNCLGRAPGWLFTRDCMAERRGRTVSEVMFDLERESASSYSESPDDENTQETNVLLKTNTSDTVHHHHDHHGPTHNHETAHHDAKHNHESAHHRDSKHNHESHHHHVSPSPSPRRDSSMMRHAPRASHTSHNASQRTHPASAGHHGSISHQGHGHHGQGHHEHASPTPSHRSHPPHVPPRRESMHTPVHHHQHHQRDSLQSLKIDPALHKDYEVHYAHARTRRPLAHLVEEEEDSDECPACRRRDSARNPVSSRAEDRLMLR